ncbi:uncharacterized protein MYCFIDRAFT_176960 [Pseudocercospora fijiensis CIRAD86]|uniref:Uncharacterized protein n=1 Tax=Pseudocercospora fijiensis (strain CIRAD86) TaxID=383855 RepID=M2YQF7_PSEFD|nr:uncharacterized protein MYCFIDRAFT_176960 [Pseudocercospora fijiensis CIRAD86]EME79960.1 hypothetical protein MYCFIDRAFT_176960 [Pseudocercospora fijiensis CIRAD86]
MVYTLCREQLNAGGGAASMRAMRSRSKTYSRDSPLRLRVCSQMRMNAVGKFGIPLVFWIPLQHFQNDSCDSPEIGVRTPDRVPAAMPPNAGAIVINYCPWLLDNNIPTAIDSIAMKIRLGKSGEKAEWVIELTEPILLLNLGSTISIVLVLLRSFCSVVDEPKDDVLISRRSKGLEQFIMGLNGEVKKSSDDAEEEAKPSTPSGIDFTSHPSTHSTPSTRHNLM